MSQENAAIYQLLQSQAKQIRELRLHLEALKRMMFEHRPAFVPAFEQQLAAVEASGTVRGLDEEIRQIEEHIHGGQTS